VRSKENVSTQTLMKWKEDTSRRNVNMMGDYCWALRREIPEKSHKRKSSIRKFAGKRKRQYEVIE
jgi:hypothetical protein